jgi:heme O synthase-like polyprenyltransferase
MLLRETAVTQWLVVLGGDFSALLFVFFCSAFCLFLVALGRRGIYIYVLIYSTWFSRSSCFSVGEGLKQAQSGAGGAAERSRLAKCAY